MRHVKKALLTTQENSDSARQVVIQTMNDIMLRKEEAVKELAFKFDKWQQDIVLSASKRKQLIDSVPASAKRDIEFAYEQVSTFATMQAYDANKKQLIAPVRLSISRTLSAGDGYDTGLDLEESRLYNDIDIELANQMQYRLRAIKLNGAQKYITERSCFVKPYRKLFLLSLSLVDSRITNSVFKI